MILVVAEVDLLALLGSIGCSYKVRLQLGGELHYSLVFKKHKNL